MIKLNETQLNKLDKFEGKHLMKFEETLTDLLTKMKKRAEYEISDTHFYREIDESLLNKNKTLHYKSIALTVSQDTQNKALHMLELSLLHPSMVKEIKRPIVAGTKKEILDFLKKKNFLNNLQTDINEMSEKLKLQ